MSVKNTVIVLIVFAAVAISAVMLVKTRFSFLAEPKVPSSIITSPAPTPAGEYLSISSQAFENFGDIPPQYTCDGQNISPPLSFSRIPLQAKSLALVVDDVDARGGSFIHWVVWNIPVDTGFLSEGELPPGAVQGLTDFGLNRYGGPCPPEGAHRYFFKLYALDRELDLPGYKKKEDLEKAMIGHILIQSQLVGSYSRPSSP